MQSEPARSVSAMPASTPDPRTGRRLWRRIFWIAVLLPLLPGAVIALIALAAGLLGCMASPMEACGPLGPLFRLAVPWAEWTGFLMLYGVVFVVGIACLALHRITDRMAVRLLGGLAVAFLLGTMPILGPTLAMGGLVHPGCQPNEGGVGPCVMFGEDIGSSVHNLATLPWLLMITPMLPFLLSAPTQ
jgi:hypothetical protein